MPEALESDGVRCLGRSIFDMLVRCEDVWGGVEVRTAPLAIQEVEDVDFVPVNPTLYHADDPCWGVFHDDGSPVDAASHRHGVGVDAVVQPGGSRAPGAQEPSPAPEPLYVYGGLIAVHYGHFLCTSLARLWPFLDGRFDGLKILFHAPGDAEYLFSLPHVRACFEPLGLELDDIVVPREPWRIPRLLVPEPSLEEQRFIHVSHGRLGRRIGEAYLHSDDGPGAPVYLSKAGLQMGVSRMRGETEIEAVMSRRGFQVVRPEGLSFAEQVRLFAGRRTVIGSVGSAFHTSLLAPPNSRLLIYSPQPVINSNHTLIDAVNGNDATYVCAPVPDEALTDDEGFLTSFVPPDPIALAEELANLAERPAPWSLPTWAAVQPRPSRLARMAARARRATSLKRRAARALAAGLRPGG